MNLIIRLKYFWVHRHWVCTLPLWLLLSSYTDHLNTLPKRTVIYVLKGADGNGSSWSSALGELRDALRVAKKGTQIWVASGIYFPSTDANREDSFVLKEGVSIYGGFAGKELHLHERDIRNFPTELSGAIGTASKTDNSYTVVYAENLSPSTIVDGLIISNGTADGVDTRMHKSICGAAWLNRSASPTIRNCVFRQNTARFGAAIYNYAGKERVSSPRISFCTFVDNTADLDGGAIFNNGDEGACRPILEDCYFENNLATYGAGVMNRAQHGVTHLTVNRCKFVNNKSLVRGSAIYNHRDNTGLSVTVTKSSYFENNLTHLGSNVSLVRNQLPISGVLGEILLPTNKDAQGSWCYNNELESCQFQGRLYSADAAKQTCLDQGSTLPSLAEWKSELEGYLDVENGTVVGDPKAAYLTLMDYGKANNSDAYALLGGQYLAEKAAFQHRGLYGYFWTSTSKNTYENYAIQINSERREISIISMPKENGLFCGCKRE